MAVHADYRNLPASARGYSVALGNFDGVHPGHRAVIDAARVPHGCYCRKMQACWTSMVIMVLQQ